MFVLSKNNTRKGQRKFVLDFLDTKIQKYSCFLKWLMVMTVILKLPLLMTEIENTFNCRRSENNLLL